MLAEMADEEEKWWWVMEGDEVKIWYLSWLGMSRSQCIYRYVYTARCCRFQCGGIGRGARGFRES